jgi:hypothetical protein
MGAISIFVADMAVAYFAVQLFRRPRKRVYYKSGSILKALYYDAVDLSFGVCAIACVKLVVRIISERL